MQCHVFRDIPNLTTLPRPPNKEERLKIILNNLEAHVQEARSSIFAEAQRELKVLRDDGQNSVVAINEVESYDHHRFANNMSAPHRDGAPDPCLSHGSTVPIDPSVTQAPTPAEIQVARVAMEKIDAYERSARGLREYYRQALERQKALRTDAEMQQQ